MPERITELTPEMVASNKVVRDRWIDIGLSTDPADHKRAEEGIREAYIRVRLKKQPEYFYWAQSPLAGAIIAVFLKANLDPEHQLFKDLQIARFDQIVATIRGYRLSMSPADLEWV